MVGDRQGFWVGFWVLLVGLSGKCLTTGVGSGLYKGVVRTKLFFIGAGLAGAGLLAGCSSTVSAELTEPLVVSQAEKPAGKRTLIVKCDKKNSAEFLSKNNGPGLTSFSLYDQDDKLVAVWNTPRKIAGSGTSVQLYLQNGRGEQAALASIYQQGQVSDYTRLNSSTGQYSVPVRSETVVKDNKLELTFPKSAIQAFEPYKFMYTDIAQDTQTSGVCQQ